MPVAYPKVRLRHHIDFNPSKLELRKLSADASVSYVPMEYVGELGGLQLDEAKSLEDLSSGLTYFRDQDVVLAKITPCFENGKAALAQGLVNGVALGTTELHVLRAKRSLDPRFLFYLVISHRFNRLGEAAMYGAGGQKRVPEDFVRNYRFDLPPTARQSTIAAYLDRETAKIDTLIAKKRELIDRLKEQRSVLISRVVTRGLPPEAAKAAGLDPNPPMKDSGLNWLASVPSTWKVLPIKRIVATRMTDGPHETPEFVSHGVPFASAEAVWNGQIHLEAVRGFISQDAHNFYSQKLLPKRDDIFIVKSGSTTGKVCIVDFDQEFNVWSPLALVRCSLKIASPRFVFYAVGSDYFQRLIQVSWSFGTQPNIGMSVLENLQTLIPPLHEQIEIARFLDTELKRFEGLTGKVDTAISRLTEYRAALITAAVTGQITPQ